MSRLLLLGGGHAQLAVLRALAKSPRADVTLVSRDARALYTGMVPGLIAGHYARRDCEIDLEALCARGGVQWVQGELVAFDAAQRVATLADGRTLSGDRVALNLGAAPVAAPGDWPSKPAEGFVDRWEALLAATPDATPLSLAVVGGGLGAVELALAARTRLARRAGGGTVWLLRGARWLPDEPPELAQRLARWLVRSGVTVLHSVGGSGSVDSGDIDSGSLDASGLDPRRLDPHHLDPKPDAVWRATGVRPPGWLAAAGLDLDTAGFIAVDAHLRATSHPQVFAAGDIAAPPGGPWPRAGVYAVRQGPVLAANVLATPGQTLCTYTPQPRALALIGDGGEAALARYGDWVSGSLSGALTWRLKQWIDRRFVARHEAD